MKIQVHQTEYQEVAALRELYRHEAHCQIIRDSALSRNMAAPYLILVDGKVGGYGAVWNKYTPGRVMEFYTLPHLRSRALPLFREFLTHSKATQIEAQTNLPLMLMMLYDCAQNITIEALLFHDAITTHHACPNGGIFRKATPNDADAIFPHHFEPVGDWVIDTSNGIAATGGFYSHYNPPYGDVFMEVDETARRQGYGAYLVQEVKRICYEAGKTPAARCAPDNTASRNALQKAGFLPCGRLLVGDVRPSP